MGSFFYVHMNYYNEINPFAAQWLRNLIQTGLIAPGYVDQRDIRDVSAVELMGYRQCHFFAGIGAWSYALRLAGWPDDKPVWTGSCPCQPFSNARKQKGFADERHLWPTWHNLISECKPSRIYGEQVASKDGLAWFDFVHIDMEAQNYAVAAFDLCAASVGAPHIRQRLFWLADSDKKGWEGRLQGGQDTEREVVNGCLGRDRAINRWNVSDWIPCRNGEHRPIEPGTLPLVDGIAGRVGRCSAYGNAIVAEVAAEFILASL